MTPARLAQGWGRLIGRYSLRAIDGARRRVHFTAPLTPEPCIWVAWHEANLMTIAAHRHRIARPVVAFAPGGLRGAAMRGWLEAVGVTPIPLADEQDAGAALRQVREALDGQHDVLIAVDGPRGPRRQAKAGALWLAAATGAPLVPVGVAAEPVLRLPRWDRHMVPLPGARTMVVVGAPMRSSRNTRRGDGAERLARRLDALMQQAEEEMQMHADSGLPEAA